ncbi:MAG: methionyl-tRNA formyltransferase [Verrucomicrobia bacterium]|nr:methionyl-tRNA formyltransferase [Verrucomicrobiota bacterium]
MPRRLVLLGSDEIALPAFAAVRALPDAEVVAVYAQPDRPAGRGQEIRPNPVAAWAQAAGLPLRQPEKLGPEDAQELAALGADLGVVMAYGQLLKADFLAATRLGFVNFHGSLLPALRGATPVEGALALGLAETGVSLQQVVLKLDAGPIHAARSLRPSPGEGRAALRARLGLLAGELASAALPAVLAGVSTPVPQDESMVTYARRLNRGDAPLDFRQPAVVLGRRVLALEGWPGSTCEHRGVTIKVGEAQAEETASGGPPGLILSADRAGVRVACGQGVLVLRRLQRPGGKMLPAGEFLAGFPLAAGETLASAEMPAFVADVPFPRAPKA